jgi:hypothetical protein
MRLISITAAFLLGTGPLFAVCAPAHADQNDLLGRAQQFLNSNNDNRSNQNAYERGRDDERRREQAQRDPRERRDNDERWGNRDLNQNGRYGNQDRETYNYDRNS